MEDERERNSELLQKLQKLTLAEIKKTPEYQNTRTIAGTPKSALKKDQLIKLLTDDQARRKKEKLNKQLRFSSPIRAPRQRRHTPPPRHTTPSPPPRYTPPPSHPSHSSTLTDGERERVIAGLEELASLYWLLRDERHNAYRRAAEEFAKKSVVDIREIKTMKGIGPSILLTIEEILQRKPVTKIDRLVDTEEFKELQRNVYTLKRYFF